MHVRSPLLLGGSKRGSRGARACLVALALLSACRDPLLPTSSFYDERIDPTIRTTCVQQTTGCHIADEQGVAAGNLDLSSYDALQRRRDVLPAYGPYPVGLLLLKGGPDVQIPVETFDTANPIVSITTDIRHNAGPGIAIDGAAFATLNQWIEAGATRSGVPHEVQSVSLGSCRNEVGSAPGFDASVAPANSGVYGRFVDNVQPVLRNRCAGGRCHGNPIADFYLACGDSEAERRWNYFVAIAHLTTPASISEILRRPLSMLRGGSFHEGGDVFLSTTDLDYQAIFDWATAIAADNPELLVRTTTDPGLFFFANRVQPVLIRKGCMFLNCHSPAMFHDLRLRGGSGGHFSTIATMRNYEMSRLLLSIESPDPNASRIIAKNLYPPVEVAGAAGLPHRGGALFEDFGLMGLDPNPATPDDCAGVDADNGDLNVIPAYCVLARWHEIERQQAILAGEILPGASPIDALVWVSRTPGVGDVRDFDTFRGGADLRTASVTLAANGSISIGASASLLGGCPVAAGSDVRNPAVSWDGTRIAFAARANGTSPLRLYWMNADGSACEAVPNVAAGSTMDNGILIHDFDPAFAPDGSLVFASTRGNLLSGYSYTGPTRTPAAMQPNANLYVLEGTNVRQLTFLLNQEVAPSFMTDGRVIFTTEKREPDFHQLALRRENLDGGDYHPLFAQRGTVGFPSATEVVELANRNLAFVAGPLDATDGAGAIIVLNRSIGPDQDDRDPADRSFIHSMRLAAAGAFGIIPGVPGAMAGTGAFRSPATLPTGRFVASCDLAATSLTGPAFVFSLCEIDPATATVRVIGGDAGRANVEAVAVYARVDHGVFQSRPDEANAHTRVEPGERDSVVQFGDVALLDTLLFSNTRVGRPIRQDISGFRVFEVLPPPASATTFGDVASEVVDDAFGSVYQNYRDLGTVGLNGDSSVKVRIPGGTPILLEMLGSGMQSLDFGPDEPFTGERRQREQMQFYPGEHANQMVPRRFFNGLCGGCHGSITGRELDIVVNVDALTSASRPTAYDQDAVSPD